MSAVPMSPAVAATGAAPVPVGTAPVAAVPVAPIPAAPAKKTRNVPKRAKYVGGVRNEQGKITAVPTDYDRKKMLPPKKSDFLDTAMFYDFKASEAAAAAERFTKMAATERAAGGPGDRAEKKRLLSLMEKMNKQMAELTEKIGADAVAALVASIQPATPPVASGAASGAAA